jgi:hypothetical protein
MLLASNYDQTRFFKAADVSQEKKLRIKDVTEEDIGVGKDKERKLCVWFTNDARGLVLNRTNNRTLRGAFGDNCHGWKGKIVVVFPTQDDFRGRMVPVLRVRIPPPKQVAGNGQTEIDDGIPESLRRVPKTAPPDALAEMLDDPDAEIPF